jgi:hypothetical protein
LPGDGGVVGDFAVRAFELLVCVMTLGGIFSESVAAGFFFVAKDRNISNVRSAGRTNPNLFLSV